MVKPNSAYGEGKGYKEVCFRHSNYFKEDNKTLSHYEVQNMYVCALMWISCMKLYRESLNWKLEIATMSASKLQMPDIQTGDRKPGRSVAGLLYSLCCFAAKESLQWLRQLLQ